MSTTDSMEEIIIALVRLHEEATALSLTCVGGVGQIVAIDRGRRYWSANLAKTVAALRPVRVLVLGESGEVLAAHADDDAAEVSDAGPGPGADISRAYAEAHARVAATYAAAHASGQSLIDKAVELVGDAMRERIAAQKQLGVVQAEAAAAAAARKLERRLERGEGQAVDEAVRAALPGALMQFVEQLGGPAELLKGILPK